MHKTLPIRKKSKWRSSKKDRDSASSDSQVTFQKEPVKLLSRCSEVTMSKFIACICDNDLSQLIITGELSPLELAEAWASLFYEYCDLAEATETKYRAMLISEIRFSKMKATVCQGWLALLSVCYFKEAADALKIMGFEDFELNPENEEQYREDIMHITGEINLLRMQIKIKEAEFSAILESQSTTSDKIDRKYFSTIFFRINNYAKREAVNGLTTVEDYCTALRDYEAYIESHKNAPK